MTNDIHVVREISNTFILGSFYDKPDPSLCDTCVNSGYIPGGSVHVFGKTYAQRYCSAKNISIHLSGLQECGLYLKRVDTL